MSSIQTVPMPRSSTLERWAEPAKMYLTSLCFTIFSTSGFENAGRMDTAVIPQYVIPKYDRTQLGQLSARITTLSP